jgi:hypothetical protein
MSDERSFKRFALFVTALAWGGLGAGLGYCNMTLYADSHAAVALYAAYGCFIYAAACAAIVAWLGVTALLAQMMMLRVFK